MANEENLAIIRQRVEPGHAWGPERLLRAAGRVVVKDAPEERLCLFGEAVATDALEAVVRSLRKRLANAAAGIRIEAKRGIGYRLLVGGDA
jgi:DNA-binding response OmpR family regulator